MQMEENQPESAAAGSGRMGADGSILMEGVESIALAAAGDRLFVHLSSTFSTAWFRDLSDT